MYFVMQRVGNSFSMVSKHESEKEACISAIKVADESPGQFFVAKTVFQLVRGEPKVEAVAEGQGPKG